MSDAVAATAMPAALRPRKATAADLPDVTETLALAFYDDPVVMWIIGDALLGTWPEWQGRGLGSPLMAPVLQTCDRDRVPAYLEATSERNEQLYLRHGFEVTDEIPLPDGPRMWPMWRAPK